MIIFNDPPACELVFSPSPTVDLTPWLVSVGIDRASEAVDGRTFGKPRRSRMGGGMDTITLALRWDPDLQDALGAHEREPAVLNLRPVAGGKTFNVPVRYGKAPIGRLKPGESSEVDLVLGVLGDLDWEA